MRNVIDATNEWVKIQVSKDVGTDGNDFRVEVSASSAVTAIAGAAKLVEHIAEGCGTTVEHVLSVLTVVLLAPDKEENKQEEQA